MNIGDDSAIEAVIWMDKRQRFGDLYLTPDALYFISYADKGPLGSVVPALAARGYVRKQLLGTPVDQAVAKAPGSRRFGLGDVTEFKKAFWTGQSFTAGGTNYRFVDGLGKKDRDKVRLWCGENRIACAGF